MELPELLLLVEEEPLLRVLLPEELRTLEELLSLRPVLGVVLLLRREELVLLFVSLLLLVRVLPLLVRELPLLRELLLLVRELLLVSVALLFVLLLVRRELLLVLVVALLFVLSLRGVLVVVVRLLLELLRRVVYTSSLDGARSEPGRTVTEPKSERRCVV